MADRRGLSIVGSSSAEPLPSKGSSSGLTRPRSGWRRWWLIGVAALVAASGVSWWLGSRAQSPSQAAARAAEPDASWITARVERRVLASTVVLRGDVRPQVALQVGAPSSVEGEGVVTRVPPVAGSEVQEGSVIVEVSGRPVFVLRGDVPVYRSLKPGMSGADVAQLQAALVRLGYAPDESGVFGEATKLAVAAFYEAAGFEPVASSTTAADVATAELALREATATLDAAEANLAQVRSAGSGSVVTAARAALSSAERALVDARATRDENVTNARVALDNAQRAYNASLADPGASRADQDAAYAALVQAQTGLSAAQRRGDDAVAAASDQVRVASLQLDEARAAGDVASAQTARDNAAAAKDSAATALMAVAAATGPTIAQGEVVFIPTTPARVQSSVDSLGKVGGSSDAGAGTVDSSALVTLAAGDLVIGTSIRSGDEGLVRAGMAVELLDETTNSRFPATVTEIAEASTVDPAGNLSRTATVTPTEPLPASMAGLNLRVTITAASSDGPVLVVPLAAVSSTAAGATRVSKLAAVDEDPVDVPVVAGISADGFVAVVPDDPATLQPGDLVVVGR